MTYRKKLIEVSLPLEAINTESAKEKTIRLGHPSTFHLWWSRKPLASSRAVIFSMLVDDPSEYVFSEEDAAIERERLFDLITQLIKWSNVNNLELIDKARIEIAKSIARGMGVEPPIGKNAVIDFLYKNAPALLDPFAGGGSIPLEGRRLGLKTNASDLNPVAVTINIALNKIPSAFSGIPPVHAGMQTKQLKFTNNWIGTEGLREDISFYGKLLQEKAFEHIHQNYPSFLENKTEKTVIAWLWVRTVKCPNPVCNSITPLTNKWWLSSKKGKKSWVNPVVDRSVNPPTVNFVVQSGQGGPVDGNVDRRGAHCIACGTPITFEYIREEGGKQNIKSKLIAVVTGGSGGREYHSPLKSHEDIALESQPKWEPDTDLPDKALGFRVQLYGMTKYKDLLTQRQLLALTTFCDLIPDIREIVLKDAEDAGLKNDGITLQENGRGAVAYADAIVTYLGLCISRQSNRMSTICFWDSGGENVQQMFARQAIPMTWNYAEANPFCSATGSWQNNIEYVCANLANLPTDIVETNVIQADATILNYPKESLIICTDPPYYDNIGYADLSDYFYIWLRNSIGSIYPNIFATLKVPKAGELIASPYRFDGNAQKAEEFFENGLRKVFSQMYHVTNREYPLAIFYAFKQAEENDDDDIDVGRVSTGWETMLEGLLSSGFQITGTWPMRTEQPGGLRMVGQNVLASSIVLICRHLPVDAKIVTRREFLSILKKELSAAIKTLQQGNIAPVDLAQAAIGPGMAIFSQYKSVLEADGAKMSVRSALTMINQVLDEYLAEQEGEYENDTRWALAWFEQYGHDQGPYGVAETLSKAKNISVEGLTHAGFLEARGGKVRLLRRDELEENWDPQKDKRITSWEVSLYLIRALDKEGEKGAGALLGKLDSIGETARDLAYRLYTICERKGWTQEAMDYNMLVVAWPRIKEQSGKGPRQESLL